ncbi:hypothetical protein BH11MYX2_BH11MYX2_21200 [soil metagenome]
MKDSATLVTMKPLLKGHVHNGQIVLDAPADLPDGTPVEVSPASEDDIGEMTDEERAEFDRELDEAAAEADLDAERGELVPAVEAVRRLLHRS